MEQDYLRYSCQLALPGFTQETQELLHDARVLIVGAGGLGCPAAQYLASSGVGTIAIADFDTISIGNLHRQILFDAGDVGLLKAEVACKRLNRQNPDITLIPLTLKINSENVRDIISAYDIVLDGTDNFETKYLLNDACVLAKKPLVHGAIYQYEGQVAVWNIRNSDETFSPNLRDIFPEVDASQMPNCAEGGVIPTLAGIIGCMQANETIKYITSSPELLTGKLLLFSALSMQTRIIQIGERSGTSITGLQKTIAVPVITVEQLKDKIRHDSVALIDVRTSEERAVFNIGGKHHPISTFDHEHMLLPEKIPTVLYCASGKRSSEAVKKLKAQFPDYEIYSLDGGLKSWKEYEYNQQ